MADIISFLRNYNYNACLASAKAWRLIDAADYLAAHLTSKETFSAREDAYQCFLASRNRLLTAMKKDVDEGSLVVDEVYPESNDCAAGSCQDALDVEKSMVQPFVIINWALANDIDVPLEFSKYAKSRKSSKSARYDALDLKKTTIHHERSRAVAGLLWSLEPEITIAEMARRQEIITYGCEGQEYNMRTICRWLANLKTDRRPGQPRKNKGELA